MKPKSGDETVAVLLANGLHYTQIVKIWKTTEGGVKY